MNIKVFLPDSLLHTKDCFLRGSFVLRKNEIVIYITSQSDSIAEIFASRSQQADIYGRYGVCAKLPRDHRNKIEVNPNGCYVSSLILDQKSISLDRHIIIFYDFETLRIAEDWHADDETFHRLHSLVTLDRSSEREATQCIKNDSMLWSRLSTVIFFVQLRNFIDIISWIVTTVKRDGKISLKSGNMLTALLMDILIGCLVLYFVNIRAEHFSDDVMAYIEVVVNYLRSLLNWLMGAPAGLKLNTAFNNMLGKFFLYHINLWWMFLELTKGGLQIVHHLYYYFGYLGITFQAAIISDMIACTSFHAYCIYVYVARLFNIQVSGLTALLRLFVGRKRNPLRGGVDSCEYTNQQLFVGTVAFTILLFLLPTTAMYYIVFTLFRVLALTMKGVLSQLCHYIKTLPLYVVVLYVIGSPRIAGNIHVDVVRDQEGSLPLVLRTKFKPRPLGALVENSRPPLVLTMQRMQWTVALSKILNGRLIGS